MAREPPVVGLVQYASSPGTMNRISPNRFASERTIVDPANKEPLSAPKILEDLIQRAERANASDIHLQMAGKTAAVAFPLDGLMTPGMGMTEARSEPVFAPSQDLARL